MSETYTREDYERAADLLQGSHDYIEQNGFNIWKYVPEKRDGPCCYIGNVRLAAGVRNLPTGDAGEGDGPELRLSLEVLDNLAQQRIDSGIRNAIEFENEFSIGRFIEWLGLNNDEAQHGRDEALVFFRRAITQVQKKLEAMPA